MTAEKSQQETGVDGNGPQSQSPQLPSLPQDVAVERGTNPKQDLNLPADMIQVEEQQPYDHPHSQILA